jgi:hypothetical protein
VGDLLSSSLSNLIYKILLIVCNTIYTCIYNILISNVIDINFKFLYYKYYNIRKYIKKLLRIPSYILKRDYLICVIILNTCALREIQY